jgi:hypothetical protein
MESQGQVMALRLAKKILKNQKTVFFPEAISFLCQQLRRRWWLSVRVSG